MVFRAGICFFVCVILLYFSYGELKYNFNLLDKFPGCGEGEPKESQLDGSCNRYSSLSCCNSSITSQIDRPINHLKMRFDFCGTELSPSCRNFFRNHFCLESCDPYLMPFHSALRRNKHQVPLCESDCRSWYSACTQEYFCARNLMIQYTWNFNETLGKVVNNCFKGSDCRRVDKIYDGHIDFCETVFNGFYKVDGDRNCAVMNFPKDQQNPNSNLFTPKLVFIIALLAIATLLPTVLYQFWKITRSDY